MADQIGENTDDSSIMPVSSLRSRFEQMGKATSSTSNPPPRPLSPNPKISHSHSIADSTPPAKEPSPASLQLPGSDGFASPIPKSLILPRQRPLPMSTSSAIQPSPAVTIEPPSSPPKNLTLNLEASNMSTFLAVDGHRAASSSGSSSPRQFKIPSRPHTPSSDSKRTPTLSSSQPPEPPPPRRSAESRRSAELRRDAPAKLTMAPPPPPVSRGEKPRIPAKHVALGQIADDALFPLTKGNPRTGQTSPVRTPSSPIMGAELEHFRQPHSNTRSVSAHTTTKIHTSPIAFDAPTVQNSKPMRTKQDFPRPDQINASPQDIRDLPEERPILPTRPPITDPIPQGSLEVSRSPADNSRSAKNDKNNPRMTDVAPVFAAPPKRIFSTPIPQSSTPPRSHGRSLTIDQTSERAPTEFRIVSSSTSASTHNSEPLSTIQKIASTAISTSSVDYPDSSQSNRRPPRLKQSLNKIANKYDTRLLDVCGDYVCTSGQYTKVWNLHNGAEVLSLIHDENTRITSVSFKAAEDPDSEGSQLWLGNIIGELLEVDIAQQGIKTTTSNAHNRREVIKIYRHKREMWTLDDGGTLNIWAPDTSGALNLESPSRNRRVPKGHTFSMVVDHELWYAYGKDIRVFEPTLDDRTQFEVLARPLSQVELGEVVSGAVISTQADRLYFGHNDGKVSIYSRNTYSCLGTVNVNIYKVNSLAGVGEYLWAAYGNGNILVYDTTQSPWVVKKDWKAHDGHVIHVLADRSSFWKLECQQVISLGGDNMIRAWDGLLEEDWLEAEMQAFDKTFCKFQQIRTLVVTWNAGATTPDNLRSDQNSNFFRNLIRTSDSPDIVMFGFQELVDLDDKAATAKRIFKSKRRDPSEQDQQYRDWREHLINCFADYMPASEPYRLLDPQPCLVGLFTCIFVKSHLHDRITDLQTGEVKRGLGGLHGNKGALILRFKLDDTSMCFINCHLAAGQSQTKDRNKDVSTILESFVLPAERDRAVLIDSYIRGGDGTMILDHEICVLNGDLNYRIDTMTRDAVVSAVKAGNFTKLLERDQLLVSMRKNAMFGLRAFNEIPITFAPTYKYDVGTNNYDSSDKKRAPAWCDRILSRGPSQIERLKQLDYCRHEVQVSDHRPVTALFEMTIKSISRDKRKAVWEDCERRFEAAKKNYSKAAKLEFLTNVCGFDAKACGKLLAQHEKVNS